MKKTILILVSILFAFTSCKKIEIEVIKDEFKEYVSDNFDDPKSLKEIINIEIDTKYDKDSIIKVADGCTELYNNINYLSKEIQKNMLNSIDDLSYSDKLYLHNYVDKFVDIFKEIAIEGQYRINLMNKKVADLEPACYKVYKIKYRVKKDGKLKVNEIYAYKYNDEPSEFYDRKAIKHYDYELGDAIRNVDDNVDFVILMTEKIVDIRDAFARRGIRLY